jgi:DNA-binding MarR family transcriptional regulator
MNAMRRRRESQFKQHKPFTSPEQAAFVTLLRTAEHFQAQNAEFLKRYDLSPTQYNVLRILRGAGKNGLPCSDVSERMINKDPDITRLLDRLERREFVARSRDENDRRVIRARITPAGLDILRRLDRPIEQFLAKMLGHVGQRRLLDLVQLLEEAQGASGST